MEKSLKCSICAGRKDLIKKLIDEGKVTPKERNNAGLDAYDSAIGMTVSGSGARSQLKECCDGVVGSISDNVPGTSSKMHHHMCAKCRKRIPEHGSFVGDYVNDNLTEEF
jgi:hypothetical protein